MKVNLIAHTKLSEEFYDSFDKYNEFLEYSGNKLDDLDVTDGQAVALTAIRTCYSANKPTEIIAKEGEKYFGSKATDGEGGTEADRLFRQIVRSKHLSTLEHLSFTFAIEGVSRALLAQLTRHRIGFSFSVQSQRYVRFGSDDKTGGFDYVMPESVNDDKHVTVDNGKQIPASDYYIACMRTIQRVYDDLRNAGIAAEDARMVLPQAATTNLVMTANLRALLDFYGKRRKGRGAQAEIAELAEELRKAVVEVEPWTKPFFE
ncbi:FAD-dependent thymidylate synthase [Aeribacillus composti]|uniref:FAD-dependent thymidylate synthase n=1 Tax=Aeribacillus composti TaxID=1868734 RepID=UPI00406A97BA